MLTLQAAKGVHPVTLTYDGEGLRIEGDLTARRKTKGGRACGCVPLPAPKGGDLTLLPIENTQILYCFFNEKTNMVQINAVIARQPDKEESEQDLYKFMYAVENEKVPAAQQFCKDIMNSVYKDIPAGKRLKVLINPFGGQGKAYEIFQTKVRPVLDAAKCKVEVIYTEHQGHALQIAKELDINEFDAIVTVSGDGVVHEVINGLLQRPDAREAVRKLPIGIIPGGTGNAMSICLLGEKAGFDPVATALQVVKGRPLALDICSVTYDDNRYFSFLSHNYGITSYADLATENLRWMGDARTVLGLLKEIFSGNTYGLEAAVDIADDNKDSIRAQCEKAYDEAKWVALEDADDAHLKDTIPALSEPVPESWVKIDGDVSFFLTSKTPLLARGMRSHPYALPHDGYLDLLLVRGKNSVFKQLGIFDKVETGKHLDAKIVEYYKIRAFRLTPKPRPGQEAYVAVDGEHAPLKTFQVQVHPRHMSVLALSPSFHRAKM
ncbi:ATP-NAD kinase-like domain-containing protein [Gongronella butleri]|nr:ATP-NAD kinase-like domain-containing protein [Gongronella butleri]